MKKDWGIHWFRRDLRVIGNEVLWENARRMGGRTLGLFCLDSHFLARSDFSPHRFGFFLNTLEALRRDWRDLWGGGDLLVIDCPPWEAFPRLFSFFQEEGFSLPSLVSWNRDYEPYALARDARMEGLFRDQGIPFIHGRDHLVFEPQELVEDREGQRSYQVFSPFAKKWFKKLASPLGQERLHSQSLLNPSEGGEFPPWSGLKWSNFTSMVKFPFVDALEDFQKRNTMKVRIPLPEAGFQSALGRLKNFQERVRNYKEERNFPDREGTSRLSPYLKNGSITVSQIIKEGGFSLIDSESQFLKELVWREFYYSVLFYHPEVESSPYQEKYRHLKWENSEEFFCRWKDGTTGFPIVDAGMRELISTGWMHNRVRMIVASFLTKDLLIDWRWGESHFMQWLLDGDLAANNGGWQWAASTGCDSVPYFRIFNPWIQGKKFDPDGIYIKKFIPELRFVPTSELHYPGGDRFSGKNHYPKPIVDHGERRALALRVYSQLQG